MNAALIPSVLALVGLAGIAAHVPAQGQGHSQGTGAHASAGGVTWIPSDARRERWGYVGTHVDSSSGQAADLSGHMEGRSRAVGDSFYISPTGDDSNSGTSMSSPWATFGYAVGRLDPGDVLNVMDGVYAQGLNVTKVGTAARPITIKAVNDQQAILQTSGIGISVTGSRYLILRGLATEGGSQGVQVVGSEFVIVDGVHVSDASYVGIWFRDNNDRFLLTDCRVEDMTGTGTSGWGIRISDLNGTGDGQGVLERCVVRNGWRSGLRVERVTIDLLSSVFENWGDPDPSVARDHGAYIGNGSPLTPGGAIEGNVFRGNFGWGLKLSSGMRDIRVHNNVIATNQVGGMSVEFGDNDNIEVFNNTFYENSGDAFSTTAFNYQTGKFHTNIKVINNIFYSTQSPLFLLMDDSIDGLQVDCNCYYATQSTKFRTRVNPFSYTNYTSLSAWRNNNIAPGIDANSIFQDPLMVNAARGDYRLESGSPCVDRGMPLAEVPRDFDGVRRPQGGAHDIGAFEYSPLAPLPPRRR